MKVRGQPAHEVSREGGRCELLKQAQVGDGVESLGEVHCQRHRALRVFTLVKPGCNGVGQGE